MDPKLIDAAREECNRFLSRVNAAEDAFKWRKFSATSGGHWVNENTKATAALRRASMDLTRVLAALRKGSAE